jgi:hypothetical protein
LAEGKIHKLILNGPKRCVAGNAIAIIVVRGRTYDLAPKNLKILPKNAIYIKNKYDAGGKSFKTIQ